MSRVQGQHSCRNQVGKGCDLSQGPGVAAAGLETPEELQRGKERPESLRDSHERLSRKTALRFVHEAKPWTRSRCPGRAGSALCSVERLGSLWGHGEEEKQSAPLPEADLHPWPHARPLPHRPRAYRRSLGGSAAERSRGRERGRGRGWKGKEGKGRQAGGGEEAGAGCGQRGRLPIKGRRAGGCWSGGDGVGVRAVPGAGGRGPPGAAGAAAALAEGRRGPHAALGREVGEEAR